jgi:RimJ/RimL family protein N-acetyltransferase
MLQRIAPQSMVEVITRSLTLNTSAVSQAPEVSWEIIDLAKHLPIIYEWVRLPYSKMFWQMDHLSFDELHEHYNQILNGSNGTSLIGTFNGSPICQVEVYDCIHDEISQHYHAWPGDIGLHFLMAPLTANKIHGISFLMMRSMLSLLLSSNDILRVMGEPDIRNEKANTLVRKAGFRFLKQIDMSYKQANLYECTRETIS